MLMYNVSQPNIKPNEMMYFVIKGKIREPAWKL
jgi:hypothetical protein